MKKVKTEFMVFGSRYRLASITNRQQIVIDGQDIKQVKHKKTLGMILDEQLKWDNHNEHQCKKNRVTLRYLEEQSNLFRKKL